MWASRLAVTSAGALLAAVPLLGGPLVTSAPAHQALPLATSAPAQQQGSLPGERLGKGRLADTGCPPLSGGSQAARATTPTEGAPLPLGGATGTRALVRLPEDEAPHHSPVEWWYFNGHLGGTGPGGHVRCYGFEYVTFQFLGFGPKPVYVGNFAITDLSERSFHYAVATASYPVPDERDGFSLRTGTWVMRGGSGRDQLRANLPGYSLELSLGATEPPVLEGEDGAVSLAGMGSSRYYSWTSLSAKGVVVDHGGRVPVRGISWMDHQWGSIDLFGGAGWDWFSVQLADRHQFMFYFLRAKGGEVVKSFGSEISPSGKGRRFSGQITESALGRWHSPRSGITYSSGWRLSFPGGHFVIRPFLADQELDVRGALSEAYWEGDVAVTGEVGGKAVEGLGYTELNPPRG